MVILSVVGIMWKIMFVSRKLIFLVFLLIVFVKLFVCLDKWKFKFRLSRWLNVLVVICLIVFWVIEEKIVFCNFCEMIVFIFVLLYVRIIVLVVVVIVLLVVLKFMLRELMIFLKKKGICMLSILVLISNLIVIMIFILLLKLFFG